MKLTPIAAESLGVRSMALYVNTPDITIFIDPAAALGPKRYGLQPHPRELEALDQAHQHIADHLDDSDVVAITHYHYDHVARDGAVYSGKTIYAKATDHHVNKSQQQRGAAFAGQLDDTAPISSDGRTYEHGDTTLQFSPPMPHGPPGTRLGYVLMLTVESNGQRLLYTSDVQGPVDHAAADYIIHEQPDIVVADGPPTYLLGWRFSHANLEKAEANMCHVMEETGCQLLLDHHLLRDLGYRKHLPHLYERHGERIQSYAEYLGRDNRLLEAQRRQLWQQ
ncbi:MAG: MBL fold metallo-hydrolase [Thermoplasmatota archaeon]